MGEAARRVLAASFGYGKQAANARVSFAHRGAEVTGIAVSGIADFVRTDNATDDRLRARNRWRSMSAGMGLANAR
jgi:hypothetical protein